MTASGPVKLYTPELLALAVKLAGYPYNPALPFTGEARSRTCGSSLEIGLSTDRDGAIESVGMRVTACAVGQASAAIFAEGAVNRSAEDITATLAQLELWLAGTGELPEWSGISPLVPAREHAGRHGALLLPWRAATAALCKAEDAG